MGIIICNGMRNGNDRTNTATAQIFKTMLLEQLKGGAIQVRSFNYFLFLYLSSLYFSA